MEEKNLAEFIFRAAIAHSHDPAIFTDMKTCINYHQLANIITKLGNELLQYSLTKDACVGVVLPNCAEGLIMFYTVSSQMTVVPLNPDYSEEELAQYLDLTHINIVITNKDFF